MSRLRFISSTDSLRFFLGLFAGKEYVLGGGSSDRSVYNDEKTQQCEKLLEQSGKSGREREGEKERVRKRG